MPIISRWYTHNVCTSLITVIFVYKDELEAKNLVQKFVNQVIVSKNEIEVSINQFLDIDGGGGPYRFKSTAEKHKLKAPSSKLHEALSTWYACNESRDCLVT
jgi:hypothetical protein